MIKICFISFCKTIKTWKKGHSLLTDEYFPMHILERNSVLGIVALVFEILKPIKLFLLLGKGTLEAKPRSSWNHTHMKPALVL